MTTKAKMEFHVGDAVECSDGVGIIKDIMVRAEDGETLYEVHGIGQRTNEELDYSNGGQGESHVRLEYIHAVVFELLHEAGHLIGLKGADAGMSRHVEDLDLLAKVAGTCKKVP